MRAWRRSVADELTGVRGFSWSQPCWGPQRIPSSSGRVISLMAAYRRVLRNVPRVQMTLLATRGVEFHGEPPYHPR